MASNTTPKPTKTYTGSCHCGANAFSVPVSPPLEDPEATVLSCNCTICTKSAYLLTFVPASSVTWTKGGLQDLTTYTFAKKTLSHCFCPVCGTSFIAKGGDTLGFNVRSFDDVDVEALKKKEYDGKSL